MTIKEIYDRFVNNYRTENGGINIYPQFDHDINSLLKVISEHLDTYEVNK